MTFGIARTNTHQWVLSAESVSLRGGIRVHVYMWAYNCVRLRMGARVCERAVKYVCRGLHVCRGLRSWMMLAPHRAPAVLRLSVAAS